MPGIKIIHKYYFAVFKILADVYRMNNDAYIINLFAGNPEHTSRVIVFAQPFHAGNHSNNPRVVCTRLTKRASYSCDVVSVVINERV